MKRTLPMHLHEHQISLHIPSNKNAGPYLTWRQKKMRADHTTNQYALTTVPCWEWFYQPEFHVRFATKLGTETLHASFMYKKHLDTA